MPSIFNRALFTGGLVLLLAFAANPTLAQEAAPAPAPRDFSGSQTLQPRTAPSEGIKVHGRWTISVTNPDDSKRHEYRFENALTDLGADVLVNLLAKNYELSDSWAIGLYPADAGGTPICDDSDNCELVATAESTFFGDGSMTIISGSVEAESSGVVGEVRTLVLYDRVAGPNPLPNIIVPFTERVLDTPIPVEAGQSVSVRVEISFE